MVRPTPRRIWKIRLGIEELLRRGSATGKEMQVVIGHVSFCFLLRRELLSTLGAVYAFGRRAEGVKMVLWPAVRRELRWAVALLPLVYRRLDAGWHGRVMATDASPTGLGAVHGERPLDEVSRIGRINERWRYQRGEEREQCKLASTQDKFRRDHASRVKTLPWWILFSVV